MFPVCLLEVTVYNLKLNGCIGVVGASYQLGACERHVVHDLGERAWTVVCDSNRNEHNLVPVGRVPVATIHCRNHIANVVEQILSQRNGIVAKEIIIQPQFHRIQKKK